MTRKFLVASAALAALAVAGCKTLSYDVVTTHAAGGGAQLSIAPTTSITLGYIQTDAAITPVVGQDGKPIAMPDKCNALHPISSYSILAGQATATATTPNTANTGTTAAAAVAINRAQAVGYAADALARAEEMKAYGPGYDAERASRDCTPQSH